MKDDVDGGGNVITNGDQLLSGIGSWWDNGNSLTSVTSSAVVAAWCNKQWDETLDASSLLQNNAMCLVHGGRMGREWQRQSRRWRRRRRRRQRWQWMAWSTSGCACDCVQWEPAIIAMRQWSRTMTFMSTMMMMPWWHPHPHWEVCHQGWSDTSNLAKALLNEREIEHWNHPWMDAACKAILLSEGVFNAPPPIELWRDVGAMNKVRQYQDPGRSELSTRYLGLLMYWQHPPHTCICCRHV